MKMSGTHTNKLKQMTPESDLHGPQTNSEQKRLRKMQKFLGRTKGSLNHRLSPLKSETIFKYEKYSEIKLENIPDSSNERIP